LFARRGKDAGDDVELAGRYKKGERMKVEVKVLFSEGCDNTPPTIDLIKQTALESGIEIDLKMILVESQEQARQWKFLGSPTVQVNGFDIDPSARLAAAFGFT
jgi:hypothetical protein